MDERRTPPLLGMGLSSLLFWSLAAPLTAEPIGHDWESTLGRALDAAAQGRRDVALEQIRRLLSRREAAPLAEALLADLQHRPTPEVLAERPANPLLAEARARWRHQHHHPAPGEQSAYLLAVASHHRHVVLIDIGDSRLYLLQRGPGGLRLAGDYYVSVGKQGGGKVREGDQRTPIGVYRITGFIAPKDLSPFYGAGALPLTYPNRWDRLQGRTGRGIWIHGNPIGEAQRPPRASDGCVTLANEKLETLRRRLDPGTPVIIAQRLQWQAPEEIARVREEVLSALEQWRRDWESLDATAYLAHYADDFRSERGDLKAWRAYKRRINARKRWIRVTISDLDLFRYPGEPDLVQAIYTQDYRSSNYRERSVKEQFWRRGTDGHWRIVYEGSR